MKRLTTICSIGFLLCTCFLSCLEREIAEKEPSLKSSPDRIDATAEFLPGASDSIKTVKIVSNRSWYAHLNDLDNPVDPQVPEFVDWASLDVSDHANLTNVTDTVFINITFERNYSQDKINGVLNFYSEGKVFLSIPVNQAGAVYHLSANAEREEVSCLPDTVKVFVNSNTAWQISVASESTADVILDTLSGFDPDTVHVIFRQNLDALNQKVAKVVFSASACENDTVVITQAKAVPYLALIDSPDTNIFSASDFGSISFNTNCNWSVSVGEGAGLTDIVFDKVSGGPASQPITIKFAFKNPGDDPSIVNSAKIIVSADYCDDVFANYHHRAPLTLDFYSSKTAPYGLKTDYDANIYNLSVPTSVTNYSVPVFNSRFRNKTDGSHGLQIPQNGYLSLPGITGMKIAAVSVDFRYHSSFKKLRLVLCSDGTSTYYSGVLPSYVITEDWNHVFYSGEVTSPESKASSAPVTIPEGQGCNILCDKKDMNNLIKTIRIVYEPAE